MNNLTDIAVASLILTETGKAISKLNGRRNWTIRMEMVDKKAYVGTFGLLNRRGFNSEFLSYMASHGTCWAEFTYKKDFNDAIDALKENGFTIIFVK